MIRADAMRNTLARTLCFSLFAIGSLRAQNSDLGLLGGISGPRGQTTVAGQTSTVSGSVTPSFQINYAWQVRSAPLTSMWSFHSRYPCGLAARWSVDLRGHRGEQLGPRSFLYARAPSQVFTRIARVILWSGRIWHCLLRGRTNCCIAFHCSSGRQAELARARFRRRGSTCALRVC